MKDFKKHWLVSRHPKLGSSQDPDKVAMRVKSIGITLIPLAIFVIRMLGLEGIQETELVALVDLLSKVAMLGTTLWAVIWQIWGWYRALRNK